MGRVRWGMGWLWSWKRELDAGAGGPAGQLGGLVAGDPLDKRAREAHWHRLF